VRGVLWWWVYAAVTEPAPLWGPGCAPQRFPLTLEKT